MACGRCRGGTRAGGITPTGQTIKGFKLTFPPSLNRPPETFLTKIEAERARRDAGGGTVEAQT